MAPFFQRYIGIDYSGAETPASSLKGLRVFCATRADEPTEVLPPQKDIDGELSLFLMPELSPQEQKVAEIEGWILGVG